ncbi:hypothetical protein [Providencia phage PSTRCR_128]|nr:hypothetical protein [Providencia phage PSTRCR_128]
MSKVSQTIPMSDTVDAYQRKIHINVRNGKVTMVHRWKDRYSDKRHTQRMTLTDAQAEHLLTVLQSAHARATLDNAMAAVRNMK